MPPAMAQTSEKAGEEKRRFRGGLYLGCAVLFSAALLAAKGAPNLWLGLGGCGLLLLAGAAELRGLAREACWRAASAAFLLLALALVPWAVAELTRSEGSTPPWFWALQLAFYLALLSHLLARAAFRFAWVALPLLLALTAGLAWRQFHGRASLGAYDRPDVVFFFWTPAEGPLTFAPGSESWVDEGTRELLAKSGIGGKLEWSGASGPGNRARKMLVLAAKPIPERFKLYYPQEAVIVYAFDGSHWRTAPQVARTFSGYAWLEPDGATTAFAEQTEDGLARGPAFFW